MAEGGHGPKRLLAWALAGMSLLLAARCGAFDAAHKQGMVVDPCPPERAEPAGEAERIGQGLLSILRGDRERRWLQDWAALCHYRRANDRLLAKGPAPRVVMIGDSITEHWADRDPGLFGDTVVNRGIAGQTSAQMLVRFRQDVVALRPRVVVIMAGLNDIASRPGAIRIEDYRNNIRAMADIAQANGIAVVLGSVTPATRDRPRATIVAVNRWLRAFAAERGVAFVDYDPVLLDPSGNPKAGFFADGVHLTEPAYAAMRPHVEAALARAAASGGH